MASKFYAVVIGAGPTGTGRAAARRFAKAYPVVVLSRSAQTSDAAAREINEAGGRAVGVAADAADRASLDAAFDRVARELLPGHRLAAAVYNAGGAMSRKPFAELSLDDLEAGLSGDARGFFNFAQKTLPLLEASVGESPHPPTLIVTGATASLKGSANFAAFAAGKWAKRALAQSAAREYGPKGVHVAHAIIDGVIDIERTRAYEVNDGVADSKISADAIAEAYWHLHTQHRSAFTHELDLRPYVEKW
ncbi:short chain dehydrogenase [Xylariaceae sp. FL0804]|nr:short chain dehydrogenase [Xylariaceae sp. FL0804]